MVTNLVAHSANGPIFTAVTWDTAQSLRETPVLILTLLTLFTSHKGLAGTGTRHRITVTHCPIGITLTSCDIFKSEEINNLWTIDEPHLLYKTGLDIMLSHPLHRMLFGQHLASSAVLG